MKNRKVHKETCQRGNPMKCECFVKKPVGKVYWLGFKDGEVNCYTNSYGKVHMPIYETKHAASCAYQDVRKVRIIEVK